MRRADREIADFDEMCRVLAACDVCRIALTDDERPYILPLNFGMKTDGRALTLYFHGAESGRKYELIDRDPRASFEADCSHRLVLDPDRMMCTMEYESVIGGGIISYVVDRDEKMRALALIMEHYGHGDFPINEKTAEVTRVFKLEVETMTGKRRAARG